MLQSRGGVGGSLEGKKNEKKIKIGFFFFFFFFQRNRKENSGMSSSGFFLQAGVGRKKTLHRKILGRAINCGPALTFNFSSWAATEPSWDLPIPKKIGKVWRNEQPVPKFFWWKIFELLLISTQGSQKQFLRVRQNERCRRWGALERHRGPSLRQGQEDLAGGGDLEDDQPRELWRLPVGRRGHPVGRHHGPQIRNDGHYLWRLGEWFAIPGK